MSRKQNIWLKDREECQKKLKKILHALIKKSGLLSAEYQIEYLAHHPESDLPTNLNHRETVREYQLLINEYKKSNN